MPQIMCYHCFARFAPRELMFKCTMHEDATGQPAPLVFSWEGGLFASKPPPNAVCPVDGRFSPYRVCPECFGNMPYYVGRAEQQVVAIAGCQATGKTIYLWSLLYQTREVLARDERPFIVPMFENDASYSIYERLNQSIVASREIPEGTDPVLQRLGRGLPPVVIRLLSPRSRWKRVANCIFYDPAGELFQSLEDVRFVRYLAHASALIYLVDTSEAAPNGARREADLAAEALSNIAQQIRRELGKADATRIDKVLSIAITKADASIFGAGDPAALVAGAGRGSQFWTNWGRAQRDEIDAVSGRCEDYLRSRGMDNLVAIAHGNFRRVRFFAVTGLGTTPEGGILREAPRPFGVENPLFWSLHELN